MKEFGAVGGACGGHAPPPRSANVYQLKCKNSCPARVNFKEINYQSFASLFLRKRRKEFTKQGIYGHITSAIRIV